MSDPIIFAAVDDHFTGRENIYMIGRRYGVFRREAARRAADIAGPHPPRDAVDLPARWLADGVLELRLADLPVAVVA